LSTSRGLGELVVLANAHTGSWHDSQLAWEINQTLWNVYDPEGNLHFPNIPQQWDKLLHKAIDNSTYDKLSKDEVLSILFGLHHRNRIIDGLWCSMFEQGVAQKLLERLLALNTDKN